MSDRPKTRRQKLDNHYLQFVAYHNAAIVARKHGKSSDFVDPIYKQALRRIYAIVKTYQVTRQWNYHNGFIRLDEDKLWIEYVIYLPSMNATYQVIVSIKNGKLDLEDYTP